MTGGPLDRLRAALKRGPDRTSLSPRQALLLAALAIVLIGAWGRAILRSRTLADAAPSGASQTPPSTESDFPGAEAKTAEPALRRSAPSLAEWANVPPASIHRNLFAVPFDDYPVDPAHPLQNGQSDADASKSDSGQADQIKERQKLVEALRAQAQDLTLEGTILGSNPRAWINGVLVGVGQSVDPTGFKVVRIESRQVFIERDGVQLELSMK